LLNLVLSEADWKLLYYRLVQPAVVIADALKMFDVECRQTGVQLDFREDESLNGFEWVMLDPARLLQVLINLL
jgi:signal transduction histidine kinase